VPDRLPVVEWRIAHRVIVVAHRKVRAAFAVALNNGSTAGSLLPAKTDHYRDCRRTRPMMRRVSGRIGFGPAHTGPLVRFLRSATVPDLPGAAVVRLSAAPRRPAAWTLLLFRPSTHASGLRLKALPPRANHVAELSIQLDEDGAAAVLAAAINALPLPANTSSTTSPLVSRVPDGTLDEGHRLHPRMPFAALGPVDLPDGGLAPVRDGVVRAARLPLVQMDSCRQ
jgi:hypothetical protein